MDDDRVYILDMYNRGIYPHDGFAKSELYFLSIVFFSDIFFPVEKVTTICLFIFPALSALIILVLSIEFYLFIGAIKRKVELQHFTEDEEYLRLVRT